MYACQGVIIHLCTLSHVSKLLCAHVLIIHPRRKLFPKSALALKKYIKSTSEIYHVDALPYESLMLALLSITVGPAVEDTDTNRCDQVNPMLGFSRDGFHVSRLKSLNESVINGNNLSPLLYPQFGHSLIVMEDTVAFYFVTKNAFVENNCIKGIVHEANLKYEIMHAVIRRDGFVSVEAAQKEGQLETRWVVFDGQYLFVNAQVLSEGFLLVEVESDPALRSTYRHAMQPKVKKKLRPNPRSNCFLGHAFLGMHTNMLGIHNEWGFASLVFC